MAPYMHWTLTKVNVAFNDVYYGSSWIDVRIYIYDKGDATHPGAILVNDTTFRLNKTGVTTIPLVTPVNISDHEEFWVAVEWYQEFYGMYAWLDTNSHWAYDGKGDWYCLNNDWGEVQTSGPDYDGNWGIGAIVEGDSTELSIGDIQGPIGITAKISNIGGINTAKNVSWSLEVNGGLFRKVTVLQTGKVTEIDVGSFTEIDTDIFFGFGNIDIRLTAEAENAVEVIETTTGFLLGPFVIGIKHNKNA
jgi:hypothetical protein